MKNIIIPAFASHVFFCQWFSFMHVGGSQFGTSGFNKLITANESGRKNIVVICFILYKMKIFYERLKHLLIVLQCTMPEKIFDYTEKQVILVYV